MSTGRIGGIVGRIDAGYSGTITNCSNTGDMTGYQYVGGIIGGCFGNVDIKACYNTGHLIGISFGKVYVGGIVGQLSDGTVDSCYNWGDIDINCWADGHTRYVAGIAGSEENHETGMAVTNCYNIGIINIDTSKKTYGSKFIYSSGGVAGGNNATGENEMSYKNCFYLEGCVPSQDPAHESYKFWCDVWKNNPKAYDTDNIIAVSVDMLTDGTVLNELGDYFVESESGYPILYWQDGSEAPTARSYAVNTNVSGGEAVVNAVAEAEEGSIVIFTVGGIESGKQLKSVTVTDASGAAVSCTQSNGSYSFTMPSRAVTITVVLENALAGTADDYSIVMPTGLDAIWSLSVDSTYYDEAAQTVTAGASVTVVVKKDSGALATSFNGITVTDNDGNVVGVTAANEKATSGVNYYGEYTFTMPAATVTVTLNAVYSDLTVYVKQDGVSEQAAVFTRAEMAALAEVNATGYYSGWESETLPFIGVAEQYITLEQILTQSGIALEDGDSISVATPDGFIQNYTYAQLTADRYYYSDILTDKTAAADKTPFGYALILKGNMAYSTDEINTVACDTLHAYRFVYGQTESELTNATKCVDSMPKCVVSITVNKSATKVDTGWYSADGTAFTLTTAAQLRGLAAIVNGTAANIEKDNFAGKTVTLGNNIALADSGLFISNAGVRYGTASYAITTTQYVLKAQAPVWTPIGSGTAVSNTDATTANAFAGTFDGNGYTVSGIYTGTKDASSGNTDTVQGLFGVVTGTVKNVTVSGCITGSHVVGGVAAHLEGGTIENCVNNAIVFADGGTTPNGNAENGVALVGAVGGIVGNVTDGSSVTDCVNNAPVTCANSNKGGRTGGIIGLIDGANDEVTIARNGNLGFVDAYQYSGGVVGANFSSCAPVTMCCNTGKVWGHSGGSTYVGGIAAWSSSDMTNCYNTGEIGIHQQGNANDKCAHFGGIVSDFAGTAITNCYNIGQLTWSIDGVNAPALGSYGGICASGYGTTAANKLSNCYVLSGTAYDNEGYVTVQTAGEMKNAANVLGEAFSSDTNAAINDGYPVLTWQSAATGGAPKASVWDGKTLDIRWFTNNPNADEFYITYPAELAGLAALVNGLYNEDIEYIYGDTSYMVVKSGSGAVGANNQATEDYQCGNYNFDGKTVYLCADIDMGSENNYMPIGGQYLMTDEDTSTKIDASFNGILDGQGHNVTLYCNRHCTLNYGDGQAVGLIGRLGCNDNDDQELWPVSPVVRNLAVYGSITANRSVGGVVGKVGRTTGDGIIENCANFATITGTDAKGTGGICGAAWNNCVIRNCYNMGSITNTYTSVGGIAGSSEAELSNCYNVGTVNAGTKTSAAIATNNGGTVVENCYWLTGSADVGVYDSTTTGAVEKTADELKAMAETLGENFRADSASTPVNGGYPILFWQAGEEESGKNIDVTVTNWTGTTPAAAVTAPAGGWVEGENTFAVSASLACVVAVQNEDGTYTVLKAAANEDGSYSFTATLAAGATIVVVVKGDVNGDGKVNVVDAAQIQLASNGSKTLSGLNALGGDVSGDGRVNVVDVAQVQLVSNGSKVLSW